MFHSAAIHPGRLTFETTVAERVVMVPTIKGRAWITRTARFKLGPADPSRKVHVLMALLDALSERSSLRGTITEKLRGAIITGEMHSGQVYSAAALAQQLGVSPTPVREAMLTLSQEGMVEVVHNKGFRVIELTDADLDQITYVRRLIEVPAIAQVASGPRHGEAAVFRPVAEAIVAAAARGDLTEYLRADRELHLGLLQLSGNNILVQIVGDLRARARLYGLRGLTASGALAASAAEHAELVDLVAKGDEVGARALMDRHIGHVRTTWASSV